MGAVNGEQLRREIASAVESLSRRVRADPFKPHDSFELRANAGTFANLLGDEDLASLYLIRMWASALGLTAIEDPRISPGVLRVSDPRTGMHEDVTVA